MIPARNESGRIAPVIDALRAEGLKVLVVEDGSTDGAGAVARARGATVLRQAGAGKGTAILAGCRWAVARGYRQVLLLDGDRQHDAREAVLLIAAAARGGLVIGARLRDLTRQPLHRRAINRLSSLLVTLAAGRRVVDSQSGFRLCDPRLLLRLPVRGRHHDLESEVCVLAARAGLRIVEVPIRVIYHDKPSGVHWLIDGVRFLRAVAVSLSNSRPWLRRVPRVAIATELAALPMPLSAPNAAPSFAWSAA